jgi:flagellar export protein FliJ
MPFLFTLQGLLRVRELQEKAELQGLQALAARVAAARAEIAALDAHAQQARRSIWGEMSSGVSGAELHFSLARETFSLERRHALDTKLQETERAHQAQLRRYLHARQQREILSHLRDGQLADYELDQSRKTQSQIDELFLVRLAARSNHKNQ